MKKNREKIIAKTASLLAAVMLLVFTAGNIAAKADVIAEPMNDSFYEDHRNECEYQPRNYIVNGPGETVDGYVSPEDHEISVQLNNGDRVHIEMTYRDENGILWGVYDKFSDIGLSVEEMTAWIPMDYLSPVYDHISFENEYYASIKNERGTVTLPESGILRFYKYPGEGNTEFETKSEYFPEAPVYGKTFTDENGHNWGFVTYHYGIRNVWICIDAPDGTAEELYPDGLPKRGDGEPKPYEGDLVITDGGSSKVLIASICAGCCAILLTATILIIKKTKAPVQAADGRIPAAESGVQNVPGTENKNPDETV